MGSIHVYWEKAGALVLKKIKLLFRRKNSTKFYLTKQLPPSQTNMAEGGGEEDLDNPFSFKAYVKKKTKQHDEQEVNTDDIFSATGGEASRKKEKQSLVVADDGGESLDF